MAYYGANVDNLNDIPEDYKAALRVSWRFGIQKTMDVCLTKQFDGKSLVLRNNYCYSKEKRKNKNVVVRGPER